MRELKLRVFNKRLRKMFAVYTIYFEENIVFCRAENGGTHTFGSFDKDVFVMTYSSLKDANGVEFCEGDIVQDTHGNKLVIQYHEPYAAFTAYGDSHPVPQMLGDWITVIGNIHENTDLLLDQ